MARNTPANTPRSQSATSAPAAPKTPDTSDTSNSAARTLLIGANELWWAALIQGVLAVFFGLVAIFWPGLTLLTLVYLFAAFVLAWGIIEIITGVLAIRRRDTWWLTLIFGIIGLGVGVYLVRHLAVSFATFILIIGLTLIVRGLFDLVGAFLDRTKGINRILLAIIGATAVAAGILLLLQPAAGGVAFVWILGLYALIFGGMTIAIAVGARDAMQATKNGHMSEKH